MTVIIDDVHPLGTHCSKGRVAPVEVPPGKPNVHDAAYRIISIASASTTRSR
jgi:hypothetical protein